MSKIPRDKIIALIFILLTVAFFSWIAWDAYTTSVRIKNTNINTEGEIIVVFYPNVTLSEVYSIINSTGGEIINKGFFNIDNVGNCTYVVIKVPVGEEHSYIDIYKEKTEVYDAYKRIIVAD